jgi:hypothetical protein
MNDLWKATVTCPPSAAVPPGPCTSTTTWTQLSGGGVGTTFPTPRAGAGGAIWQQGRLVIHGGADANGNLGDLWEWDFGASTWRQNVLDSSAGVLAPPARSGFAMIGDFGQQRIFAIGGTLASGGATDQAWLAGHEAAAKLLLKLPFSLPALDQAKNLKLSIDALGISDDEQAFVWDGTTWRFLGGWDFTASPPHITATTTAPVTSLVQPDGNVYVLLIQANRVQFNFGTGFVAPVAIDRLKFTMDFQ